MNIKSYLKNLLTHTEPMTANERNEQLENNLDSRQATDGQQEILITDSYIFGIGFDSNNLNSWRICNFLS